MSPHIDFMAPVICYVYILRCADNTCYTGITGNIPVRMAAHELGFVHYTKKRRPISILRIIPCVNRHTAAQLERRIKNTGAMRWLRRHYPNDYLTLEKASHTLAHQRSNRLDSPSRNLRTIPSTPR